MVASVEGGDGPRAALGRGLLAKAWQGQAYLVSHTVFASGALQDLLQSCGSHMNKLTLGNRKGTSTSLADRLACGCWQAHLGGQLLASPESSRPAATCPP